MALRTQRPGVKPSTQVKGVITDALRSHFAETSHTPQFKEVWTYEVPLIESDGKVVVEIHGETRFSHAWAEYRGPLGRWLCDLRNGGVRGTPREVTDRCYICGDAGTDPCEHCGRPTCGYHLRGEIGGTALCNNCEDELDDDA